MDNFIREYLSRVPTYRVRQPCDAVTKRGAQGLCWVKNRDNLPAENRFDPWFTRARAHSPTLPHNLRTRNLAFAHDDCVAPAGTRGSCVTSALAILVAAHIKTGCFPCSICALFFRYKFLAYKETTSALISCDQLNYYAAPNLPIRYNTQSWVLKVVPTRRSGVCYTDISASCLEAQH